MIVLAAVIIATGDDETDQSATHVDEATTRPAPPLPLSEVARSSEARLNGLIAQFRSIPEDMVLPEASVEFERIESSHIPDLQHAHREARATVLATSDKADDLDADYATSVARICSALEGLIAGCETLGRERLAVQSRFIEARHPSDTI
jgi:hypothetical protein